jgi:xanthine dehydrogenase YagR molybdenum-binding subunit
MAEKLGIDPIEFRILNDTQVDPEKPERPFSQRQLTECLRTGAERFGWSKRNPQPGRVRDGRWLLGIGTAVAFRNNLLTKSAARVRLDNSGIVTVETDMTDIGTGSYTIIAQTAAEMMGVPLEKVVVRLGDSAFPASAGSGGQWGGNNSTAGVYAACVKLREAIAQKLGFNSAEVEFTDGEVRAGNRAVPLAQAVGEGGLSAEDAVEYGDLAKKYQQSTFRRAFRRSRRRCRDRRDPRAPHACRVCRRPHPQSEDGAQPGDRRDDHGGGSCADGRTRRRQAPWFLRQS